MTKEQAIKDFEGTNENYRDQLSRYGYVMDKAEKDVVNQIIERNEMAISALKGEWISVEEGEPEEFQEVLISINGTKGKKVRSATYWGNGQYHTDNGDTWRKDEKGLEAWQPKPEPYKKGGTK